jgi:hypothetical protein
MLEYSFWLGGLRGNNMRNNHGFIGFPVMQAQQPAQQQTQQPPQQQAQQPRGMSVSDWIFMIISAILATLDTIVILASFDLTFSSWIAWLITFILVIIFYLIYRGQGIHGILVFSVFISIFGYLALGPYSGVIRPVMDQAVESIGIAKDAITAASYDVWLLATNPTEWYARQQVVNVIPERPMSYPKALEITSLDTLSPSIPADEEFKIIATIENEGASKTRNVKISYECNKWCNDTNIDVKPPEYKEEGMDLEPGKIDRITLSGFIGIALEKYRAESHTAKVDIGLSYSYSTNASLLVEVASENDIDRRYSEGKEVYHNVLAIDKGATARLSLNVGKQPIQAGESADVLISVSNARTDGKVILETGKEIIIKMDKIVGTLGDCQGKQVECNITNDNTIATCKLRNDVEIKANKFNTILPIYCSFTASDVELSKTGLITAELPDYTFVLEKDKSITITTPLGIIATTTSGEGGGEEILSRLGKPDAQGIYTYNAADATPLYYRYVNGAWQWSPDRENWMPTSTTVVSGGKWDGIEPVEENIEIIEYLEKYNPTSLVG